MQPKTVPSPGANSNQEEHTMTQKFFVNEFIMKLNPVVSVTLYRYGKPLLTANACDILDSEYVDSQVLDWDFSHYPLRIFLV